MLPLVNVLDRSKRRVNGRPTPSNIVLPAGYNGINNNFGEILASSIGGYVYYDANNDGTFQGTESPIPGTTVTLTGTDDLGNPVTMSMATLADGSYLFSGLRPGTYQLTETQPAAYLDGKDTIGTPGGTTSNDQFSNIALPAGFNGVNNNFGEIRPGEIRGRKFLDETGNGLTSDDSGFGGVTIYIDADNHARRCVGVRRQIVGRVLDHNRRRFWSGCLQAAGVRLVRSKAHQLHFAGGRDRRLPASHGA